MSALVAVLPLVWATVDRLQVPVAEGVRSRGTAVIKARTRRVTGPELAFYRKYTEGMLRRYVKLSMEAGRTPSLLGQEMFRGRVTSYRVRSFEDVVIFVHDMEKCVARLDYEQQQLIRRIGMQEYTQGEAAQMLGLCLRTTVRRYAEAVDRLTQILLELRLLEPMVECQGAGDCQ